MSDDQFQRMCSVFGFAPSRALREMMDAAVNQARTAEREACAIVAQSFSSQAASAWPEDQFTEKAMRSGLMSMTDIVTDACASAIRARGQQ